MDAGEHPRSAGGGDAGVGRYGGLASPLTTRHEAVGAAGTRPTPRVPTSPVGTGTSRGCGRRARRDLGTELGTRIGAHHRDYPGSGPMAGRMHRSRARLRLQTGSHPQSSETLVVVGIIVRTTTHRHP